MGLGRHPMVNADRFSMVPRSDVPRSVFDVRHFHKTTFASGILVPFYVDEVLPGDSHSLKCSILARLATPIVPVMDNMELLTWFFFVPNRLIWEHWEAFMGQQASPSDTTQYLTPTVAISNAQCAPGTLADYFGITMNGGAGTVTVQAMPFRAYNLIWNDWFRDEDLQNPLTVNVDDGPDTYATDYATQYVNAKHNYFTTARPWPQKPIQQGFGPLQGGPFVPGGSMYYPQAGAPVSGLGVASGAATTAGAVTLLESGGRTEALNPTWLSSSPNQFRMKVFDDGSQAWPDVRVLINDIRQANMVQVMMEKNARGGTRYAEIVRSHFGVVSPDARLQRPEFLGGGHTTVTVNPVAQTSPESGGSTVLGQLAAAGYVSATGHGFSSSFTEHGWVIGLMATRTDLTYQNGVNRMWRRRTQFDFFWPALAHLGEQAIMVGELYTDGSANDLAVFGYQERWAEYRWRESRTSGYFRSSVATPLDMWHYGIDYSPAPALNGTFIVEAPPISRVLQVTAPFTAQLMADAMFEVRKARALPMFSIPGMGGRL